MRSIIAGVFAVVATALLLSIPLWVTGGSATGLTPSADLAPVNRMIDDLRARKYDDARSLVAMAPQTVSDATLDKMAAQIPKAGRATVNVTQWTMMSSTGSGTQTTLEVYYDYGAPGATVTQAVLVKMNGVQKIQSIYLRYLSQAVLHTTDFHWPNSRSILYLYLAVAVRPTS